MTKYKYWAGTKSDVINFPDDVKPEHEIGYYWGPFVVHDCINTLATLAAEDFHGNHDGWDIKSWVKQEEPIVIVLYYNDIELGRFDVALEYSLKFYVTKQESEKSQVRGVES